MAPHALLKVAIAFMAWVGAGLAHATGWDESTQGDLSNDRLAPTPVTVAVGSNVVTGLMGNSGNGTDRDYFKFTVPDGLALGSLVVLGNTFTSGGSSFIAMQTGPQITVTPQGAGSEHLIGYAHYSNDQVGTDILPNISAQIPLPAGTYSVWIQETGGTAGYEMGFVLGEVAAERDVPILPGWGVALFASSLLFRLWQRQGGRT